MPKKVFKSEEGKKLLYESYDILLKMWGVEVQEQDIETTYGRTHIITAGDKTKPTLVMFHGTGDNSALMWIQNIRELTKHFYVVAVDTLGAAGKSEPNELFFKNFDETKWINEIINTLNIKEANMIGVSFGVILMLNYAIKYPDKVNKLVGMAGHLPIKVNGLKKFLYTLRTIKVFMPEILNPNEKNAEKLFQKLSGPNIKLADNDEVFKHFYYIFKHSVPLVRNIASHEIQTFSQFRDNALFLIGDHDKLVYKPDIKQAYAELGLNLKIIKDAGHSINGEQPELINKEIINFLVEKETMIV
ncbi:alpha/beta fold hydrolase [Chengkuizengella marina]|uniref:Alpha/beta hydrolase n=1 Tax=Chengkuizengella marina TaxID=2507566 RepID=A0A6N9Q4B0_9BACL|nr:alpha/beta hydrolase [Chengkuizengella marina]NBI29685.1 alpha/beta hydrolase [Chengkuizengella marina]